MRTGGNGSDATVQIQTSQSRVYMASGMSGSPFPARGRCPGGGAAAAGHRAGPGRDRERGRAAPQVALAFADDGSGADAVATTAPSAASWRLP
ncbi:hypothetical protein LP420_08440 [Massilia sp. B-10]|nr:hypothetical protein LP420_08440 [Massilia sp. B-10]